MTGPAIIQALRHERRVYSVTPWHALFINLSPAAPSDPPSAAAPGPEADNMSAERSKATVLKTHLGSCDARSRRQISPSM